MQLEIAELLADIGFSGMVTLVVPRALAQCLLNVNGHASAGRLSRLAKAVGDLPPTILDRLEVRFELGDLPVDRVLVRERRTATVVILPRSLTRAS
jgi:hypothetical protein